jgi:hypothetical protein
MFHPFFKKENNNKKDLMLTLLWGKEKGKAKQMSNSKCCPPICDRDYFVLVALGGLLFTAPNSERQKRKAIWHWHTGLAAWLCSAVGWGTFLQPPRRPSWMEAGGCGDRRQEGSFSFFLFYSEARYVGRWLGG